MDDMCTEQRTVIQGLWLLLIREDAVITSIEKNFRGQNLSGKSRFL